MAKTERGAALIMTLLMLLVMTLLAMSSMDRVTLQEKMVSAQRQGDLSLEMVEDALREAEAYIEGGTVVLSDFDEDGPLYAAGAAPDINADSAWAEDNSFTATATQSAWTEELGGGVPAPRYFIELIGDTTGESAVTDVVVSGRQDMALGDYRPQGFRIVARSLGVSGNTKRVVEVYYAAEI